MSNEVNDFLMSGGAKAFQFNNVGDIVRGTVVSAELRQQTDLDNNLLTWSDGKPRMQLVVTLQTDLHDNDDDDGMRTIYAKGGRYEIATGEGQSMRDAIADAIRDSVKEPHLRGIDPGDELAVGYTGLGKAKRGMSPPKLYAASFKKATSSVKASDLFDDSPLETGV